MELVFSVGKELVVVKIEGKILKISFSHTNFQFVPMEQVIAMNISGILNEFPDLKGLSRKDITRQGVKRWLAKINDFKIEEEIKNYVIKELEEKGMKFMEEKR